MESQIKDRSTIDIIKTVGKHADIIGEILPVHALTGCDTVACCYGVVKGTTLKVVKAGVHSLALLGQDDVTIESVIHQTSEFISAWYGYRSSESMSETRFRLWHLKQGVHYHQVHQNCTVLLQQIKHLQKCKKSSLSRYCVAFTRNARSPRT
jgi:hypothetical protein